MSFTLSECVRTQAKCQLSAKRHTSSFRNKALHKAQATRSHRLVASDQLRVLTSSSLDGVSSGRTPLPGISFSVSGFLFTYYCGVVDVLESEGLLQRGRTELAGTSGGGIVSAMFSCGVPMDDVLRGQADMYKILAKDDDLEVQYALEDLLRDLLPEDAHERMNRLPVRLAVTRIWPPPFPMLVDEFSDKEDLVGALVTGCYGGGGFVGNAPYRMWRDSPCIDGGSPLSLDNSQPPLLCASDPAAIEVCAFPAAVQKVIPGLEQSDIFPDVGELWAQDESWKFMLKGIGRVQPGGFTQAASDMNMLRELGQKSTQKWIDQQDFAPVYTPIMPVVETVESEVESEVKISSK